MPAAAGSVNVTVALLAPVAGFTCVPSRYCHCTALPFASYSPTQSPAVPGPLATVAVTVPPAVPLAAPKVMLGALVVIVPLVAISVYVALYSSARNVPGVAGSRNVTVALLTPDAGSVCAPLRYCHCTLRPLRSYKPIQSPAVPGPFTTDAVTSPPALPAAAPSVTAGTIAVTDRDACAVSQFSWSLASQIR